MISLGLRLLQIVAVLGFVGAAVALLLGLVGVALLPLWHGVLMIACGVVAFVGLLVLQLSAQQRIPRRDFKKVFLGGCPPWMRWSTTALSLAGVVLWFGLAVVQSEPAEGGVPAMMAGAFGLFLFPPVFASTYSYQRQRLELDRCCSRGHELPFGASFCPTCGEPVNPPKEA